MPQATILGKLFESEAKVRLMRLFLMNPGEIFDTRIIAKRAQMKPRAFARDLKKLLDVGYIKRGTRVVTHAEVRPG